MVRNVPPRIDKKLTRHNFDRLLNYLVAQDVLPSEHVQFLTGLYHCYEQALRHAQAMEQYGNEMEVWARGEAPRPKHPVRPKPPKLNPYGTQTLEYNAPYMRHQPKIRYEYVCAECGEQRVHFMIPSPFKPRYCVRENGQESECQRAARLRKLKVYNATRSKKAGADNF